MGRYIDDILQPGEKILYSTTIHGIIYVPGLVCLALAGAALFGSRTMSNDGVTMALLGASVLLCLLGGVLLLRAWFQRWTTETDVTSLRLVHKEGFIKRQTFEMSLDKIESVDVTQSIAGRIFGWGDVTVNGVGEGTKTIKMIGAPVEFRNHITAR
ncbi:MAG: PH domain-containing protein [Afipia sp.]|nr:PH domain-containing protein [Afipia sp.]